MPRSPKIVLALCLTYSIASGAQEPPKSCVWNILSLAAEALGLRPKRAKTEITQAPKVGPAAPKTVEVEPSKMKVFIKPDDKGTKTETAQKAAVTESRRTLLHAALTEKLNQGDRYSVALKDFLAAAWVRSLMKQGTGVAVLFGNRSQKIIAQDQASVSHYVDVLNRLVEKQVVILYDADSKMAPFIQKIAGPLGIGIASGPRLESLSGGTVLTIENPYLRMEAFSKAEECIVSSNSVVGLGLMFSDKGVSYIMDPDRQWHLDINSWQRGTPGFFGLKSFRSTKPVRTVSDLSLWGINRWTKPPAPYSEITVLAALSGGDLEDIQRSCETLVEGEQKLSFDADGQPIPGGAVLLGSSTNDERYTALVYGTGRELGQSGVPVAHGGSGGYMEVVGAGAFDIGGISIGIPLTGGFRLKSEASVARGSHSLTVDSNDYTTRIPLLLWRRKALVFAPGGSGTMRELSTALVQAGGESGELPHFVFLAHDYYGSLVEGLIKNIPYSGFTERLHLIAEVKEWQPLLSTFEQEPGFDVAGWRTAARPTPRNDKTEFPKKSWYSWEKRSNDRDRDWLW